MYTKPTLENILLSLSYKYGESSIPSAGIDNRKKWINDGIEFISNRLKPVKSVSATVSSGVCSLNASTADPAYDFKSIYELRDSSGMKYSITNKESYDISQYSNVCCITGDYKTGYTLNVKNDGTYTLYYNYFTDVLTNLTDVSPISDIEAVSCYAYSKLRMSETDPLGDADKNMEECIARTNVMANDLSRNEGELTFKTLY